ncbi:MAG: hypothetical protein HRT52_09195 [Colwellia sp.]|nr:hypothetical protein [Colwellia sp.]
MCSTPRPRGKITAKTAYSGSLLSNISAEARLNFSSRANMADEQRYKNNLANEKYRNEKKSHLKSRINKNNTVNKSWRYWLVNASFKEIIVVLFFGYSSHR